MGFNLVQGRLSRASNEAPENVTITEITPTSAKISWSTPIETSGAVVQYGIAPTSLTSFAPVEGVSSTSRSVELTLLTPGTTYYFEISYGQDKAYNNFGVPWSFVTKGAQEGSAPIIDPAPTPPPAQTVIPTVSPLSSTPIQSECVYDSCELIKSKLGKGCNTQDYMRCIKKSN